MVQLSHDLEILARRVATAERASIEDTIRRALEARAKAHGLSTARRRMSAEQMLAAGAELAAMALLDQRSPQEIMDDLNAP